MSELTILVSSIKTTLLDIAKQTHALGIGLQNAAPGEKQGVPNHTVSYLLETAETLNKLAQECELLTQAQTPASQIQEKRD